MWQKFFVWALKFALQRLGADVDAETQKQLDDYNRRRVELEEKEKQSAIVVGQIETKVKDLETLRNEKEDELLRLQLYIPQLDEKLEKIRDEKNKKLADLQSVDDNTILRGEL